jgi:hypothetical protein
MPQRHYIPVQLDSGRVIQVEAATLNGEQDVSNRIFRFSDVTNVIEELSQAMARVFAKAKPRTAEIEFGIEVSVEAGQLTALLVSGGGSGSLRITLSWEGETKE